MATEHKGPDFDVERDTTRHDGTGQALSRPQEVALEGLLAGMTVTDAAAAAEVSRSSIYRWRNEDYAFQAEWNRLRGEAREALQGRLASLSIKAVEVVEGAVDSGDLKAAMAILKGIGALSGLEEKLGSADPDVLRRQAVDPWGLTDDLLMIR